MSYPPGPGQQPPHGEPQRPYPPQGPPQHGHPPHGYPQQGHPQQPYPQVPPGVPPQQPHVVYVEKPNAKPAYEMGTNFVLGLLGTLALLLLRTEDPRLGAAVFGALFTPNDVDASETLGAVLSVVLMLAAAVTAGLLFARLPAGKWVGIPVALVGVGYYVYALIWLLTNDADSLALWVLVALVVWTMLLVGLLLPRLSKALRRPPQVLGYG